MLEFKKKSQYKNKKCFYGIGIYKGNKVFYKIFEGSSKCELDGYSLVKKYYKVPQIIDYDDKTILYEYIENLISNTLFEYFYFSSDIKSYDVIMNQYRNSMRNYKCLDENESINKKFFKDRVSLVKSYIDSGKFAKYENIFNEIIEMISLDKKLTAYVSQGDPTDTNITIDGIFSDFENGGYNSLVGEISILVISVLTHGSYFYPKYNSKVYRIRPNSYPLRVSYKNIEFILAFLNLVNEVFHNSVIDEVNKYLKYYICFRVLTPLNLLEMSSHDQKTILKMIDIFYNVNSLESLIEIIKNWNLNFIKEA